MGFRARSSPPPIQKAAAHMNMVINLSGPWAGFAAGWMFMCAKSSSAATAALGFAGYALGLFGAERLNKRHDSWVVGLGA